MGDGKGKWVMSVLVVWAALAQIAPGIFQLQQESMMWGYFVGPTVGWILLAIVAIYILFRLDSVVSVWPTRRLSHASLDVLSTTEGVSVYRVAGGASAHLHLQIVNFLPGDVHLDNLTVRL